MSVIACNFRNVKIVNNVGLLGSYQLSCTVPVAAAAFFPS